MTVQRTDVTTYDDFSVMQALTRQVWSRNPRWHVGELAWSRYSVPGAQVGWRTSLWHDAGRPLAWGWVELPGDLSLVVDPSAPELIDAVLEWFDNAAGDGDLSCLVLESETAVIERLEAAGFTADDDAPYFRYHSMRLVDSMGLVDLPEPSLAAGFQLRHVEPGEAAERAAVHRAGWSDFGSRVSTESYQAVMAAYPYRPELDWVVTAPDGTWVASALGWLDDVNRAGLLEPVGCAPPYRRRGLARAVNIACLRALREAGAETAHVNPRGDQGYPVPGLLYRSIGFQPAGRTLSYRRPAGIRPSRIRPPLAEQPELGDHVLGGEEHR